MCEATPPPSPNPRPSSPEEKADRNGYPNTAPMSAPRLSRPSISHAKDGSQAADNEQDKRRVVVLLGPSLSRLSDEVLHRVMRRCAPHELFNLIQAYPHALDVFLITRSRLIREIIRDLEDRFGGRVPRMCLFAARLRGIHSKWALWSPRLPPTSSLERSIKAAVKMHLKKGGSSELHTSFSLRFFCFISDILTRAELIISKYSSHSWNQHDRFIGMSYFRHPKNGKLVLSESEKVWFLKAICWYDAYCSMFFYNEKILFNMNTPIRQNFFHDEMGDIDWKAVQRFYSIVFYIHGQYKDVLSNIMGTMKFEKPSVTETMVDCLAKLEVKDVSGYIKPKKPSLVCSDTAERFRLIHYLTCQGLQAIFAVLTMTDRQRKTNMLELSWKISAIRHPAITLPGFEVCGEGTHGDNTWTPWAYIATQPDESHDDFKCAMYFWDRERLRKLTMKPRCKLKNSGSGRV